MNGLYHKDIGFPKVALPTGIFHLKEYSNHALRAAKDDRYGEAKTLPKLLNMAVCDLVEIEVEDAEVVKAVVRFPYSLDLDLVIVFMPTHPLNKVKTVWFNKKSDKHKTLQHWKYDKP